MIRTKDSSVNVNDIHPILKSFLEDVSNRFDGIVVSSGKDAKHSVFNSRHYCLPLSTKVLTQNGFKFFDELTNNDYTVGFNKDTKQNEWTKINDVFKFDNIDLFEYSTAKNKNNIVCTENHKWITEQNNYLYKYEYNLVGDKIKRGKIIGKKDRIDIKNNFLEIDSMCKSDRIMLSSKITNSFYSNQTFLTIDEVRLIAWFITDGTITKRYRLRNEEIVYDACIYQKKEEFFPHIEKALSGANVVYVKRGNHNKQNVTRWLLRRKFSDDLIKRSKIKEKDGLYKFLFSLDYKKLEAFIDVCEMAEGGKKEGYKYIYQYKKDIKEIIGIASYLLGNSPVYTKHGVYQRRPCIEKGKLVKRALSREDVFCISTSLKSFTILQNDRIMLTGNSGLALDFGKNSSNATAYENFKQYVLEGKKNWHLPTKFAEYQIEDILDEDNHIHVELIPTPKEKAIIYGSYTLVIIFALGLSYLIYKKVMK